MSRYSHLIDEMNYHNDPRTQARLRGKWYDNFDSRRMRCLVTTYDYDEDLEICGWLPVAYEVCTLCSGRGTHTNPSIDASGISQEEFDRDPDFEEDYRRGVHDVACYECGGQRVIPTLVEGNLSPEQEKLVYGLREREERAHAAEVAAERRMGC